MGRWDTAAAPGTEQLETAPPPPLRRVQIGTPWQVPGPRPISDVEAPPAAGATQRRPATHLLTAAVAADVVVAAGQAWVLRSGGDCAALPCSVATLGGRPAIALALAVLAALTVAAGTLADSFGVRPRAPGQWDAVRWAGLALTVLATAGAALVAVAVTALVAVAAAILVTGVRVLGQR